MEREADQNGVEPSAAGAGGDTIRRNASFAFLAQIAGAVFTAGLTVFLARRLGASGFGVLSLGLGIASLVLLPSDFGISNSVARFVAEHRGDRVRVVALFADGLRLKLIASSAGMVLLFLLAGPVASAYGIPELVWVMRALAIALFGQSLMMIGVVFVAERRVRPSLWAALIESTTEVTATVALVLAGAGVTGAAFGRAIGFLVGGAATLFLIVRMLGPAALPRSLRPGRESKRIAAYGGVLLIIDGAVTAFNQLDLLVIAGFLGPGAVGVFAAPLKLIAFLGYPGSAVASAIAPRLAKSSVSTPDPSDFLTSLRLLIILQAAATAFVLGWAPLLTKVLGSEYAESTETLRALAPFVFLGGFGPLVSLTANYLGEAGRRVPIAIVTVLVNLGLDLLLVPRIGVVGAAVGTDVAYLFYAPAHLLICRSALDFDLRPAARTFARVLLAAAAMTGVLLIPGDSLRPLWRLPPDAIAAALVFCGVLWLTGEVTRAEARNALRASPLARLRRRAPAAGPG